MKIVLINPPQPYLIEKRTQVPLGLLYLSAVVKRERPGHDVSVVDVSPHTQEEALEVLPEADIYGLTATTLDYSAVKRLACRLKQRHRDCMTLVGGPHPTIFAPDCLEDGFDGVFKGEAEDSIFSFLDNPRRGVIVSPEHPVDITKIPRPDRDALSWVGGRVLTTAHQGSINIMASRGCPHNCSFCASKVMWGRRLRWRTVDDVVAEIRECIEAYGIKVFRFSDDNMVSNKRWTREFCKKVGTLGIKWRLSIRVDDVEPGILREMALAGCTEVGFGVESFDLDVLKALNKRIVPEQSIRAIRMAHEAGIGARLLLMISTPGETSQKTVDRNIDALEAIRGQFVYVSVKVFKPLPGTDIWNRPRDFGVTIDSTDFPKYNFYVYRLNDEGEKERFLWSPISIDGMTKEQQEGNIDRMCSYVESLPENADG